MNLTQSRTELDLEEVAPQEHIMTTEPMLAVGDKTAPAMRVLRRALNWPAVQLRLDLDTRCNLRCDYCSTGHSNNADRGPFPASQLEDLTKQLGDKVWSVFLSCTGEPLFNPQFDVAMEIVGRNLSHCDVQIVSNATLLTEKKAIALLAGKPSRVFFSIDSVDPDRYARLRPGAKWETTRENLERFMRLRGRSRWPTVTVTSILSKSNEDEIEKIAAFCAKLGVDAYRVQHLESFADVPTTLQSATDSNKLRFRFLKLQFGLLRRGIVFDQPFALRWEKLLSVLLAARLHRDRLGYFKYLVGSAFGHFTSPCRRIGWETVAFRNGVVSSCVGEADAPWDPSSGTDFLRYLRAGRKKHRKAAFDACADCNFHKPQAR